MRKSFVLLFVCLLMLGVTACDSGKAEREQQEQLQEQYARFDPYVDLIDALENDDFGTAYEIIDGYKSSYYNSQVNERVVYEISIDDSNWIEYFEVKEVTQWCENDLNETTGFIIHVVLILKEEYVNRVVSEHSQAAFGWEALCSAKNCDVDLENQIVTFENVFKSNSTSFGDPEILSGTVLFDGNPISNEVYGNNYVAAKIGEIVIVGEYLLDGQTKPVCFDYDDISITHAEGVLALYDSGE